MEQHPHLRRTEDVLPANRWYNKINKFLAVKITNGVGTMWCAYAFCILALVSLPPTLEQHSTIADIQWIAQTFLQLVLLSVIIVGQNIAATASDDRAIKTYEDTEYLKSTQQEQHDKLDKILGILNGSQG